MRPGLAVASLGMYDLPWLLAANDALWAGIADGLRAAGLESVPAHLERGRDLHALWVDPGLLLGQTCGFPLVTTLAGRVRVVATPHYDMPGCAGGWNRSFLVVRGDDPVAALAGLRGRRCAINGRDSNTGMSLLRATIAPLARGDTFFASVVETGAHLESLRAVREARADVAAIDCVTHGLTRRHAPALLAGTRVLAWTPATPALPLVTSAATPDDTLRALRDVLGAPALAPLWRAVGVRGLTLAEAEDYAPVSALARLAAESGYPRLA